jgi:hypothetical protein
MISEEHDLVYVLLAAILVNRDSGEYYIGGSHIIEVDRPLFAKMLPKAVDQNFYVLAKYLGRAATEEISSQYDQGALEGFWAIYADENRAKIESIAEQIKEVDPMTIPPDALRLDNWLEEAIETSPTTADPTEYLRRRQLLEESEEKFVEHASGSGRYANPRKQNPVDAPERAKNFVDTTPAPRVLPPPQRTAFDARYQEYRDGIIQALDRAIYDRRAPKSALLDLEDLDIRRGYASNLSPEQAVEQFIAQYE